MTPERIEDLRETASRVEDVYDGIYDPHIGQDMDSMLDEIERLQGIIKEAMTACDAAKHSPETKDCAACNMFEILTFGPIPE